MALIELCIYLYLQLGSWIEFIFLWKNMKSGLCGLEPITSKIRTQVIHSLLGRRGAIFAPLQFVSIGNESIFYIVTCPPIRYAFSNLFQGKILYYWCKLSPRWERSNCATSVCMCATVNATAVSLECEQWLQILLCDK